MHASPAGCPDALDPTLSCLSPSHARPAFLPLPIAPDSRITYVDTRLAMLVRALGCSGPSTVLLVSTTCMPSFPATCKTLATSSTSSKRYPTRLPAESEMLE
jgi:hypothetical protein